MSAEPVYQLPTPQPSIPHFEGNPVAATRIKLAGMGQADISEDVVISTDDRIRLVGEFRVTGVRHYVDEKTGDLIREQIVKPIVVDLCPWDAADKNDNGILRARRHS